MNFCFFFFADICIKCHCDFFKHYEDTWDCLANNFRRKVTIFINNNAKINQLFHEIMDKNISIFHAKCLGIISRQLNEQYFVSNNIIDG